MKAKIYPSICFLQHYVLRIKIVINPTAREMVACVFSVVTEQIASRGNAPRIVLNETSTQPSHGMGEASYTQKLAVK